MKPSTILPILTLLLPQALAATDYQNALACGQRFPRINGAIEKFCYKKNTSGVATNDLVIPSAYASVGSMFYGLKGNKLVLQITGQCSPAQWVPAQWCLSQFHEMCAQASHPLGWTWRNYGNNGCQRFEIKGKVEGKKKDRVQGR